MFVSCLGYVFTLSSFLIHLFITLASCKLLFFLSWLYGCVSFVSLSLFFFLLSLCLFTLTLSLYHVDSTPSSFKGTSSYLTLFS